AISYYQTRDEYVFKRLRSPNASSEDSNEGTAALIALESIQLHYEANLTDHSWLCLMQLISVGYMYGPHFYHIKKIALTHSKHLSNQCCIALYDLCIKHSQHLALREVDLRFNTESQLLNQKGGEVLVDLLQKIDEFHSHNSDSKKNTTQNEIAPTTNDYKHKHEHHNYHSFFSTDTNFTIFVDQHIKPWALGIGQLVVTEETL
ncbi:hypothetical protein RFI_37910, partial [Reticulomyxa filosa]